MILKLKKELINLIKSLMNSIYNLYRYACGLLRQGMKQIEISLDNPHMDAMEKQGNKEMLVKVY